jgi:hypothetical protein
VAHTFKGGINMNLKDLLEKHTKEGQINFDEAEVSFQNHINGIVTKDVKKKLTKQKEELMTNFISELGIEANDLDGVKKWVSTVNDNTTDFKTANTKLQKELENALNTNKKLSTEYTEFKQDTLLSSLGVDGEKKEFLKYKFNRNISDDVTFESQVAEYKKANRGDTHRTLNPNFQESQDSDPVTALKKIRGIE